MRPEGFGSNWGFRNFQVRHAYFFRRHSSTVAIESSSLSQLLAGVVARWLQYIHDIRQSGERLVVDLSVGEAEEPAADSCDDSGKDPAAGLSWPPWRAEGGKARAKVLSSKRRKEIARAAQQSAEEKTCKPLVTGWHFV